MRWLNSNSDLPNSTGFITIVNGKRNHTAIPLSYMNQFRTDNVYTLSIREKVSKKVQFSAAMSVAKTSIQIAVTENVTDELIAILTYLSIGILMIFSFSGTEPLQESQGSSIQDNQQPLLILPEVSNPEYHRPKGRSPHKRYKSVVKNDRVILSKSNETTAQKTCSYCSGKGYNI
ncbi:hypothetical protein RhiirA5_436280 [Rhizophagus irregularis]|uniref:Uncharacterized protein n=1 Tax=Rhizophagus irregularis TaxID=588596 RepID=A0A2N0QSD8_9GLOM|nr:hypothetical protein RhiirA5_436280 [Rhizophagus irregularis]PKC53940.1 hypothetical protein RhiirA1_478266 [Rhizophagus irregularis]